MTRRFTSCRGGMAWVERMRSWVWVLLLIATDTRSHCHEIYPSYILVHDADFPGISINAPEPQPHPSPLLNNLLASAEVGYCSASALSESYEKIARIQFNTIDNSSSGTAGYEDFTNIHTVVEGGSSYAFTATISHPPYDQDQIIVWIDFNQDGDFEDSGEQVFSSPVGTGPHSTTITIPSNASPGMTRMRVRLHDSGLQPNLTPCGDSGYGQVEDYSVMIGSDECPDTMSLASPLDDIESGQHKFEVNAAIDASNRIMGGQVIYDAGISVNLMPGFTAGNGAELIIQIDGCANQ
jgi:hypothetical protein